MSIGSRWRNFRTGVRGIRIILRLVRVALGHPALASEPLESALRALESANRTTADRPSEDLLRTERQVRARLVELRSAN